MQPLSLPFRFSPRPTDGEQHDSAPLNRTTKLRQGDADFELPAFHVPGWHRRTSSAAPVARVAGRKRAALVVFAFFLAVGLVVYRHEEYSFDLPYAIERPGTAAAEESPLKVENGVVRLADRPPSGPLPGDEPPDIDTVTRALVAPSSPSSAPPTPSPTPVPADPPSSAFPPGLFPITLPSPSPTRPLSHPLSLLAFSRLAPSVRWRCLDEWVAHSRACEALKDRFKPGVEEEVKIDVAWTWVNGSEGRMAKVREEAADEVARKTGPSEQGDAASVARHFREHDELRYSVRSVLSSFGSDSLAGLHLVAGDIPDNGLSAENASEHPSESTSRLVQVPTWLDVAKVEFAGQPAPAAVDAEPVFRVQSHSELFSRADGAMPGAIPSFNSLAIEAQTANLDSRSPSLLAINDDNFLLQPLATTDVDSPLSGPVFRMFRHAPIEGIEFPEDDPEGEWRSLKRSNWALDQRFGKRGRFYLVHIAKSLPMPLSRELQSTFPKAFAATAAARFRGRAPSEINPHFLLTHFTMEKQREALLWSYIVARFDHNGDGLLSRDERVDLLTDLLTDAAADPTTLILSASRPRRDGLSALSSAASFAGLPPPRIVIEYTSQDGSAYFAASKDEPNIPHQPSWPSFDSNDGNDNPACTLSLFSPSSLPSMRPRRPEGLEAFLPEDSSEDGEEEPANDFEPFMVGDTGTRWEDIEYAAPTKSALLRRKEALLLIQRYAYTLGNAHYAFEGIHRGGDELSAKLEALSDPPEGRSRPVFLALNDDIEQAEDVEDVDGRLRAWFSEVWSERSEWEKE
ncbi:hypothetical protein JCM10207_005283 [Rhodosporidiobolus poonsookiae]